MKTFSKTYPFLFFLLLMPLTTAAEESVIEEYIADVEAAGNAQTSARNLLQHRPQRLHIRQPVEKTMQKAAERVFNKSKDDEFAPSVENDNFEETSELNDVISYDSAPFNLLWGTSVEYMRRQGWKMQKVEREGYQNVYEMSHAKYPNTQFTHVAAAFGQNNRLWCIFAEGQALDDDASASKVLELYGKYYDALSEKYGNAELHFEPATYVNENVVMQKGRRVVQQETTQTPVGNEHFLQELYEGRAKMISTFYNDVIGVTLGVYVDDNAKSHLLLDYKNLLLLDKEAPITKKKVMEGL